MNTTATLLQNWPTIQQGLVQFFYATKERTIEIIKSPITNPDMLWLLIPLIASLILLEFYFGRYSEEELGWNTAFGNSLALIFISIILAKHMYDYQLLYDANKVSIVASVLLVGIILAFLDFFHALPKEFAFKLSAKLPIDYLAFIAIVFVFTNLPANSVTAAAFFAILVMLVILIGIIHKLAPKFKEWVLPEPPAPTKESDLINPPQSPI